MKVCKKKITFQTTAFLGFDAEDILTDLHSTCSSDGFTVKAIYDDSLNGLDIMRNENAVIIRYSRLVYFYRALGLICEHSEEVFWHFAETASFQNNGLLVDCSRNAVPTIETVKKIIRQLALMGMNVLMLYMEDTYQILEEPYFGYMRGKYTQDELRELDMYAAGFGVEIVPCIQTLAHLNTLLQLPAYQDVADCQGILLLDETKTYALIEKEIAACRSMFHSNCIHIGFDEAHMLGRGKYYDKHGSSDLHTLMCNHLQKVSEICAKYNFKPIIWSDMFFRTCGNEEYNPETEVSPEIAERLPSNVLLTYWDYYDNDQEHYDQMLKLHLGISDQVLFAGGAWKWNGYFPYLRTSIERTANALRACKENGISTVFTTGWSDDGADASFFSILPVIQFQAELNFYHEVDEQHLRSRLKACTDADLHDFILLDMSGKDEDGCTSINYHKYMLFQDLLLGLFDRHIPEGTKEQYENMYLRLSGIKREMPYGYLFDTAKTLASVLSLKAELGVKLKEAYDNNDWIFLQEAESILIPTLLLRVEHFRDCLERQWMIENKPFGFETQDLRIGALIQRLKSSRKRLKQYLSGELSQLAELEEIRLPFYPEKDGKLLDLNQWKAMVTPSVL